MTQQTYDANAVLMGGGGPKAWKFEEPGTTRVGTIAAPPVARQERDYDKNNPGGGDPKFYPSGDPIMGVVVEVQTTERDPSIEDDTGARTFYVEGRYIKEAVRDAVRAAGAPGLEVGGQLSVTFTHREDPMDKRSRKFWNITYVPAGNAALMGGAPGPTELTGQQAAHAQAVQPAPAQQYVQPQQAAPAAQPVQQPVQQQPAQAAPAPAATPTPEQLAAFNAYMARQQATGS